MVFLGFCVFLLRVFIFEGLRLCVQCGIRVVSKKVFLSGFGMTMDRIGNLPDEIICDIVSFLVAKEAAFTRTLSKRCGNLFQIIPKLRFDDSKANSEGSFERFVHEVMSLPVADRVRTFSLTCNNVDLSEDNDDHFSRCIRHEGQYEDHISRCVVCHVVVKHGVVALKINLAQGGNFSLPFQVFTCNTVSTMKLGSGFVIDALPTPVFLPSLKNLYLDSVRFYHFNGHCSFQPLISESPVLEELVIDGVEWENGSWCCTVSSTTLRRLTIRRTNWGHEFDGIYVGDIIFDTPTLTYLYYSDYVLTEYPLVNLNSVVEATIFLKVGFGEVWYNQLASVLNPMNLVNGITNVEIV